MLIKTQRVVQNEFRQPARGQPRKAAVVAKTIVAAATEPKPRPRYTAGPLAGRARVLRRLAPAAVFDKQIRKLNQLAD